MIWSTEGGYTVHIYENFKTYGVNLHVSGKPQRNCWEKRTSYFISHEVIINRKFKQLYKTNKEHISLYIDTSDVILINEDGIRYK